MGREGKVTNALVDQRSAILEQLEQGKSLTEICQPDTMPNRATVVRWMDADPAFGASVTRAREVGFAVRAEATMVEVRDLALTAPNAGRLLLDAERWYLGKLSNAFSDNKPTKVEVEVELSVEALAWFGRAERSSNG